MAKREHIEPHSGEKRYVRRDEKGRFTADQVDVGRSLSQDVRKRAQRKVTKGDGDKGDES